MLATVDRHGGQRTRFGPYAIVECSPVAWMRGVYLGAVHVVAAAKSSQSGYQADCFIGALFPLIVFLESLPHILVC